MGRGIKVLFHKGGRKQWGAKTPRAIRQPVFCGVIVEVADTDIGVNGTFL